MKVFKYRTFYSIGACLTGVLVLVMGIGFLNAHKFFGGHRDPIMTAFGVVLMLLGVGLSISQGLMKFGKKVGVGEEGILLPNGVFVPWQKVDNVKGQMLENWDPKVGTTRVKSVKFYYLDEAREKIAESEVTEHIQNFQEFKALVLKEFAKHKRTESDESGRNKE